MAKKQNITLTDLVTQNPNLKASLQKFEGVKQQLDERAKQCLLIKVIDEASLNICEQNLVKMNELVSAVEEVHKSEKAPHWENCKAIDAAKNYILDFDVDPIKHLKDEKVAWIKKQEAEKKRKEDVLNSIDKTKHWCESRLEMAKNHEDCEYSLNKLLEVLDRESVYQEFFPQIQEVVSNYTRLFRLKQQEFAAISPDELDAIKEVQEELKQNIESATVIESTPTEVIKKVRKTWKFQVADINDVPREFLCVDEDKVKEFMKSKVDTLKDGEVRIGIRFYQEISVTV